MIRFSPPLPALLLVALFSLLLDTRVGAQEHLKADLDVFVTLPDAFQIKPDDLEIRFPKGQWSQNPYFKWLTEDHSRAIFQKKELPNLTVDLTLLGGKLPVEEAIIDFENGQFLGVTISIFNRGDGGQISIADYRNRFDSIKDYLTSQLQTSSVTRTGRPNQGLLVDGLSWVSARGKAILERNAPSSSTVEFLRMRLARRDAGGVYEAALQDRAGATVKLSELPSHVNRTPDGDVRIQGIPMVDQGAKGYCVVASTQRLFEYYGIACDMHQLAQVAGSDPRRGTSIIAINDELSRIDYRFKTRFTCLAVKQGTQFVELVDGRYVGREIQKAQILTLIQKNIDQGIPILWALEVGQYPEEPPLKEQLSGGHMRMMIGYNLKKKQILFSDSWGAGHESKRMDVEDALQATLGLFVLKPTTR